LERNSLLIILNMKNILFIAIAIMMGMQFSACEKEKTEGPNDLGGETNITLTEVGRESSVYISIGTFNLPTGTMKVVSNNDGVVTYNITLDLTGSPDSAIISALIPAEYKDAQGRINTDMKFKITSEGMQDYFTSDQPWTVAKYADGVGTQYTIKTVNGDTLVRTITEKTGVDEWPLGFYLIKTSKVEQPLPASDEVATKITYRVNHKFGLVYMQVDLKNGEVMKCDVVPWFLL